MTGRARLRDDLRAAVRPWLTPRTAWARATHNLGPKLLSLLVALTLWYVATSGRRANVEQVYDVPVTVRDTTGGRGEGTRAVGDLSPQTVRVTLEGPPERLRELRPDAIQAVVDVTGLPEGNFSRPVTVTPPAGTALSRRFGERVTGFVDTQIARTLPVTVGVAAPPETSLPRYAVSPAEAGVRGPGRAVAGVRRVVTSPASIPASGEREVPLIALNEAGAPVEGVVVTPETVTIRRLDTGEVPIKTLPVVLTPPPAGLRVGAVSLQPSSVRVVAAPELLARLREVSGRVAYTPGTSTLPVVLTLPAGAQALDSVSVRLTVEREPAPRPAPAPPAGR